jgi:hypothetical protein
MNAAFSSVKVALPSPGSLGRVPVPWLLRQKKWEEGNILLIKPCNLREKRHAKLLGIPKKSKSLDKSWKEQFHDRHEYRKNKGFSPCGKGYDAKSLPLDYPTLCVIH